MGDEFEKDLLKFLFWFPIVFVVIFFLKMLLNL